LRRRRKKEEEQKRGVDRGVDEMRRKRE